MELPPLGRKKENLNEKFFRYVTSSWIFEKPIEKIILILIVLFAMYSVLNPFLRWLFG